MAEKLKGNLSRARVVDIARLLAAIFFLLAAHATAQPVPERPWRVLILNDGDSALPAFIAIDRAMRAALTASGKRRIDIFSESLDMLRFPVALHERELAEVLARKYADQPPDAVIAVGSPSLDFAEKHRDRLWPEAYILFTGVPVEALRARRLAPTTTGFPTQHDLAGTVGIALQLRPSTRRVIVIAGSGEFDRMMARVARVQLEDHARRLPIEYWQDLSIDEYLRRVARLDRDDAVLYLAIIRDGEGRTHVSRDVATLLSAASPAPFYGPLENLIGQGIAAGMVYSFEARGRRMGELIQNVLTTRPSGPLPLGSAGRSSCMADARQLERFGMSTSRLPPGCEIRFIPPSLWREYGWYAFAALLVILLQSALILGLVLQRRGRVRAEGEVRRGRAELEQGSRLALAGELTASIAHEINQPLGAILANAGAAEAILRRDPAASSEVLAILADIRKADIRASEIIRRVRSLVTARQAERERIDVNSMVGEVLAFLQGDARRRGVAVYTEFAPGLPAVLADRVQLQQAVVNLCVNAMEATADRAPGDRRLGVCTAAAGGGVEIGVSDTGPGISPQHLPQVFDSFFTTKPQGTGLGLAITRSIVESHGGTIAAQNRDGGGALFRIVMPA